MINVPFWINLWIYLTWNSSFLITSLKLLILNRLVQNYYIIYKWENQTWKTYPFTYNIIVKSLRKSWSSPRTALILLMICNIIRSHRSLAYVYTPYHTTSWWIATLEVLVAITALDIFEALCKTSSIYTCLYCLIIKSSFGVQFSIWRSPSKGLILVLMSIGSVFWGTYKSGQLVWGPDLVGFNLTVYCIRTSVKYLDYRY